jgi:hypothetical protein
MTRYFAANLGVFNLDLVSSQGKLGSSNAVLLGLPRIGLQNVLAEAYARGTKRFRHSA